MKIKTRDILAFVAAAACLIGFIVFAVLVIRGHKFNLDSGLNSIVSSRTESGNKFFKLVTHLGSIYTMIAITLVLLIIPISRKIGVMSACNLTFVGLINVFIKLIFKRPRPDVALRLVSETGYSFPSAHAMIAFAFYGLFIYLAIKHLNGNFIKTAVSLYFALVIILTGYSRNYLAVHYPTDILAGFLLGAFLLIVFVYLYNYFAPKVVKKFKQLKNNK